MTFSKKSLLLLLVAILVMAPFMAYAQDDMEEIELEETELAEGVVTVGVPDGWVANFNAEDGSLAVANSEETMELVLNTENGEVTPESDQFAILLVALPGEFLGFLGIDTTVEMEAGEFASMVAEVFGSEEEGLTFSEEAIIYEDEDGEPTHASLLWSDEDDETEGIFFVKLTDELLLIGVGTTAAEAFEDYQAEAEAIFASLEIDAEAYIALMENM